MKINQWIMVACLTVTALLSLTTSAADKPLKVGFVYIGPIGDHGWTYEHEQGRLAVEKYFGDKVKTTYVQNVSEGADAQRVITQLAQAGNQLIFTTSFGFMNPTVKVAKRFPNVKFEHATGYKRAPNLSTYTLKTFQGRYVSGVAAAMLSKTNTIGYIASFPIPEVIRDIDAVYLGAKSVNPNIKIKIVWVNTWYDPGKESDAANTLMDQGADILIQHTDSPAPLIAAEKRGMMGVGQASDMKHFAPKAQMYAVQDNWGPYYIDMVKKVMNNTWKSEDFWGGFQEGDLKIVSMNPNLPDSVKTAIKMTRDKIASGLLHPFTGPIKDNTGKIVVPAGHVLTNDELRYVNWYVEGIDAKIPH